MKISKQEKGWVSSVKKGNLEEGYKLFCQDYWNKFLLLLPLSKITISFAILFINRNRNAKSCINYSDTAIDLSTEFLLFWKKPDVVGRMLIIKSILFQYKEGSLPARGIGWLAHWLVFQGKYKIAKSLFEIIDVEQAPQRLKGEIYSLLGNYHYCLGEIEKSLEFHMQSTRLLRASGDKFFQMFNVGSASKTIAETNDLDLFEQEILSEYDGLNPNAPDERYGLRVLIQAAYTYYKNGEIAKGKLFEESAKNAFSKSGSKLDQALYHLYLSAIRLLFRDIKLSKTSIKLAKLLLADYGKYCKYQQMIKEVEDYLFKENPPPELVSQLCGDYKNTSNLLESWHKDLYRITLPSLENFNTRNISDFCIDFEKASNSKVSFTHLPVIPELSNDSELKFDILEFAGGTSYHVEVFHRNSKYLISCNTKYQSWRNSEITESLRAILVILQSISKQEHVRELYRIQSQKEFESELARRLAHDIRSPISTLQAAIRAELETDLIRDIISTSAQRIDAIASSLLRRRNDFIDKSNKILVKSFFETLVACKRLEKTHTKCELNLEYGKYSASKYIETIESELDRTISNILNNAFEASPENEAVLVRISNTHTKLQISITDKGMGISDDIAPHIFKQDFSHGKSGSGMGLFYAKKFIDSVDGNISFCSSANGTTFRIEIPLCSPPDNILTSIDLHPYENIYILDDYLANLDAISSHLTNSGYKGHISCFSDSESFKENTERNTHQSNLYLVDYDLIGSNESGLDIVSRLGIQSSTILVTNHFENQSILSRCQELKIPIIPKFIFQEICIRIDKPDVVIIDDDKYMKAILEQKSKNALVSFFEKPEAFYLNPHHFPLSTLFFVDNYFENSHSNGKEVIEYLVDKGFENLYDISSDINSIHPRALKIHKSEVSNFLN